MKTQDLLTEPITIRVFADPSNPAPMVAMTPEVREAIYAAISLLWNMQTLEDMAHGDVLFALLTDPKEQYEMQKSISGDGES